MQTVYATETGGGKRSAALWWTGWLPVRTASKSKVRATKRKGGRPSSVDTPRASAPAPNDGAPPARFVGPRDVPAAIAPAQLERFARLFAQMRGGSGADAADGADAAAGAGGALALGALHAGMKRLGSPCSEARGRDV